MNVLYKLKQTNIMNTFIICLEIFIARMIEMSISSIRTIMLVKGKSALACVLAFIEILIWFFVAREALIAENTNMFVVISYALGYSVGTYFGGIINKYFVRGVLTAFIVTENKDLSEILREEDYGVSIISHEEGKHILLVEFKKKNMKKIKDLIKENDEKAFLIINESLHAENGYIN